jgi:acyl-CoA synthetase (AMP-forming)/AMP-acid ligase II
VLETAASAAPDAAARARSAAGPPRFGEILILATSGTTGTGKLVPVAPRTIMAGAAATCAAYQLTSADRRLNVMPFHHVQGLEGSLVASLLCGSSIVCVPAFDPATVLETAREYRVTWYSGSPTMHRRILAASPSPVPGLPDLRFIRSGSAPLPPSLRQELEAAFGVPVTESYGMTEAHQIASTPLDAGGRPPGMIPTGSRIAIRSDDGSVSADPDVSGEVLVAGPNVIRRYADRERAADPAFVGEWFRTGDQGRLTRDGRLVLTGRIKELINRGGEKISPGEVEKALLGHEAVSETLVYPAPHPELTEEVAAAVVLRPGHAVADHELRDFAARRLSPHKVPRYIRFLSVLPQGDTGKPSRRILTDEHGRTGGGRPRAGRAGAGAPPTPLQARLAEIWSAALGGRPVGVHDDFYQVLGGESLHAMVLLAKVRESLGAEISHLTFADYASTVSDMADLIAATSLAGH